MERYEDYLTGTIKKVSVTLDRNTPQSRKTAQKTLVQKIAAAMDKTTKKDITLKELVEEYRKDQMLTAKQSTYTRNFNFSSYGSLGKNIILSGSPYYTSVGRRI